MKHKKIRRLVKEIIEPLIQFIKRSRKTGNMPYKKIEGILNIVFPETKYHKIGKGFYKHVFTIHVGKRKFALKIGRSKKHIIKDWNTYKYLIKKLGKKKANRYFAKICWIEGLCMLQKYGERVKISKKVLQKFKAKGKEYGLIDIKPENIMKVDGKLKVVDAERSKRKKRSKRQK